MRLPSLFLSLALISTTPLTMLGADRQHPGMAFEKSALPSGGHPFAVAVDDLNGDGNLDLAVSNPKDNRLSLHFGRGDGSFAEPVLLATGKQPRGVVAVDFNQDGNIDLAVSSTGDHAVAVHDGRGDGTFSEVRLIHVGQRPFLLTAAHLNKDGFTDLIVPDEGGWQAWLLFGDGKGGFGRRSIRAGKWSSDGAAGDFNGDQIPDLALTNWGSNNVSVHLGTSPGHFAEPTFHEYRGGSGHALYCVKIVDLDRDGLQDMLWNDVQRNEVFVLYGDGKGDFPRYARLEAGGGVRSLTTADLNADGWLDVAASNLADDDLSVMLADGRGGFHETQYVEVGTYPRMVVAADLNKDTKPDLVVTNMRSNDVTVLLNDGPTMITVEEKPPPTPHTAPVEIERLSSPKGIAFDAQGRLLVADQGNHRVVRVAPDGTLVTLAGTGKAGYGGDGGPAYAAQLRQPSDVAVDEQGNVFIADSGNHRIRKITTDGTIATVVGVGKAGFSGDGGPATEARIHQPLAVAVANGEIYIADAANLRVRKVASSGTISTVVGTGIPGRSHDGRLGTESRIKPINDLAIGPNQELLLADTLNSRICKLDGTGTLTTVAGSADAHAAEQPETGEEQLGSPTGLAITGDGKVFIADEGRGRVFELSADGSLRSALPPDNSHPWTPSAVAVDRDSNIYFSDADSDTIQKVASSRIATFAGKELIAVTRHVPSGLTGGTKKTGDAASSPELKLEWEYTFRSGSDANAPYAVQVAEDGTFYIAGDTGSGADWYLLHLSAGGEKVWAFEFDGGEIDIPHALLRRSSGDLVTAGTTSNEARDYLVISVTKEGKENWRYSAVEKGSQAAYGAALDEQGNILVAGESHGLFEVINLTPAGEIRWRHSDVEGGARAIDVDPDGNILVAGFRQSIWRVLKLGPDGTPQWEHQVEGRSGGFLSTVAYGLRNDAAGNSIVAGVWNDRATSHLRVEKLDAAGRLLWEYIDEEPLTTARGVAITANGGAVVVGDTAEDWLMLELDPNGRLLWRTTHDGGGGTKNPDQAHAVALTGDGGFVVAGVNHPVPPQFPNLGAVEWRVALYKRGTEQP